MGKKFFFIITLLLSCTQLIAQRTQQLKDSAATFPPMPKESVDLFPYVQGVPTFGSGTPFNDLEYTLINVDYIDGENGGSDVFMPVNPSEQFPGANTVKVIKCVLNTDLNENYQAADRDRIILGTAEHPNPFFLRGTDGIDNDYLSIVHFDFENGAIQLKGSASDYELVYCDASDNVQTTGWYLFYTANNTIDLVAFIFPCDFIEPAVSGNPPQNLNPLCNASGQLDLNDPNQFIFATPVTTNISIPEALSQMGTNGKEIISGMAVDSQNNTYLLGHTDGNINGNNPSSSKVFVTKINPLGSTLWTYALDMRQGTLLFDAVADDTHLFVCGRTLGNLPGFSNAGRWDGILLKLDLTTGQLVASDQWGNQGIDAYGNIELDDDGNFFVSGQGSPAGVSGTNNVYLVAKHRKSDLGNEWRTLNPTAATGFSASAEAWGGLTYQPTAMPGQGRLIAAGWYMAAGGANAFISIYENLHTTSPNRSQSIILNSSGGPRADWILDNTVDDQGNIYVAGYTTGNLQGTHLGEGDAFIIKYSPQLTNRVIKQFGTNKSDLIRKLSIDSNNNLYAIGYTYGNYDNHSNTDPSLLTADILVQKFDQNLNFLDSKQFGSPYEERSYATLREDVLFVSGMTEGAIKSSSFGSFDGFLAALDTKDLTFRQSVTVAIDEKNAASEVPNKYSLEQNYPNPFNPSTQINYSLAAPSFVTIELRNAVGMKIATLVNQTQQAGEHSIQFTASNLSSGVYFYTIIADNYLSTKRMLFLK